MYQVIFLLPAVGFWALFYYAFRKDRSRYRNCYLLFLALLGSVPFVLSLFGDNMGSAMLFLFTATLIALLIVPFFLIHNGIVMIKRDGRIINPRGDSLLEEGDELVLYTRKFIPEATTISV